MADSSLPRQSGKDCTQPISCFIRQPGSLPWLPLTIRSICSVACLLSHGLEPELIKESYVQGLVHILPMAVGSWGESVEWRRTDCCIERETDFGRGSMTTWGGVSLTGKNKACHHWRQSQCREISRWISATSGNSNLHRLGPNSILQDDNARSHRDGLSETTSRMLVWRMLVSSVFKLQSSSPPRTKRVNGKLKCLALALRFIAKYHCQNKALC